MARSVARARLPVSGGVSPRLLSVDQWAELDEDEAGELVDGGIEGEEMPTILHELVVAALLAVLRTWAIRRGGIALGSEVKIAVAPRRGRKPDVSVYLPPHLPAVTDTLVRVPPHIVVEILSPRPRDAHRDRIDKWSDYARARADWYWIVDPALRTLELYRLDPAARSYTAVPIRRSGTIRGLAGLVIDVPSLWAEADAIAARGSH